LLEQLSNRENTAIFIFADHGEEFGEHGRYFHSSHLYDELVHVPFLAKIPSYTSPVNIQSQVRMIDLAPTIYELAGVAAPEYLAGKSLLPLVAGTETESRLAISEEHSGEHYALRTDQWKYIFNAKNGVAELYNLENDPGESLNCLADHPQVSAEFQHTLDTHRQTSQVGANFNGEPQSDDPQMIERLRALGYVE